MPGLQPAPEIRGPLISLLTQLYTGAEEMPDVADGVFVPDAAAGLIDAAIMFVLYVKETEAEHGGNFLEFLQRQALEAEDPAGTGPA